MIPLKYKQGGLIQTKYKKPTPKDEYIKKGAAPYIADIRDPLDLIGQRYKSPQLLLATLEYSRIEENTGYWQVVFLRPAGFVHPKFDSK